jgi:hypothetical protein
MPLMVFEPTIPVFERAKTFHALDRATTVIGHMLMINNAKLYLRPCRPTAYKQYGLNIVMECLKAGIVDSIRRSHFLGNGIKQ